MDTKHYHRFGYRWEEREDRKVDIHALRDADAFNHLTPMLHKQGYEFGKLIFNTPIPKPQHPIPVDDSFLKPSDLLVLTTRPPMDDVYSEARKAMCPSYTTLEEKVFNTFRSFFDICARDQIKIARFMADRLPAKYADRGQIQFRQRQCADYRFVRRDEKGRWKVVQGDRRTALFLVLTGDSWPNGPRLLAVFGIGGNETLVWAYLLQTRLWRDLQIDSPRFVMAEMKTGKIPPRPHDLSFADNLDVRVLLNVPLEDAAFRRAS
ncbi:MAG: hypothetical protein ABIH26_10275 [Candidatus Eisenbacteria bacterium]